MKFKKNIIFSCLLLSSLACTSTISAVLTISQYGSDIVLQKPYFNQDDYTNISFIFAGGFANQAYTQNSAKVHFLEQFGPENLLNKFIDQSIPNFESFGQGQLHGEFKIHQLVASCYKNMNHGFFIEAATNIQDLRINNITLTFSPSPLHITEDQINNLEILQSKIPNSISRSGMFTTAFYTGWGKTYSDYTHLDFIDLTIKIGLMTPQAMSTNNQTILQFPFIGNLNFGYPVIATASIGLLDWITLGCHASVIPWQATTKTVAMNQVGSHNSLLIPESGIARVQRAPLFTTGLYFEADHFHQGFSATVAYSYTQSLAYRFTPIDMQRFNTTFVNQSELLQSWSIGSIYLQFDIDFATEIHPNASVISLLCNIPVGGTFCSATNMFGGSCSLQISYLF